MDLIVESADVWAANIPDKPGSLAGILAALRDAGADPRFVICRRAHDEARQSVVFVSPLKGDREIEVASTLGFNFTASLHSIRVSGRDRPGILAEIVERIGDAGINLRGLSACVNDAQFVAYVAFDQLEDANRVTAILGQP